MERALCAGIAVMVAWLARMDAAPRHGTTRLELARIEVESVARFAAHRPGETA